MKMTVVTFTKRFVSGLFEGLIFEESMAFVSVKLAEDWIKKITSNKKLPYIIENYEIERPLFLVK